MGHMAFDVISNYVAVFLIDKIIRGFRGWIEGNSFRSGGRTTEEGRVWQTGSVRFTDSSSKEPFYDKNILADLRDLAKRSRIYMVNVFL